MLAAVTAGLTAEQIESERERNEGEEEECTDDPDPDPETPGNFQCVSECPDGGNHSEVSEEDRKTCFGESDLSEIPLLLTLKFSGFTFDCYPKGIPYCGKFLRLQTFVKMPPKAPEETFAVLIFATKPCIVRYQLGC